MRRDGQRLADLPDGQNQLAVAASQCPVNDDVKRRAHVRIGYHDINGNLQTDRGGIILAIPAYDLWYRRKV